MNDLSTHNAVNCIENLQLSISSVKFGYKIQALAAHVLLRQNFQIKEINQSGHPDIIATRGMDEFHFEVEAEVTGPRPRQLTDDDFEALTGLSSGAGFFALAISFPKPRWIVIPAERLKHRQPSPNVLLEALSNKQLSNAWTVAYISLLNRACRQIGQSSFRKLCKRALSGRGL